LSQYREDGKLRPIAGEFPYKGASLMFSILRQKCQLLLEESPQDASEEEQI
jgi:hypothetical protein